jgi:hypothetical protein
VLPGTACGRGCGTVPSYFQPALPTAGAVSWSALSGSAACRSRILLATCVTRMLVTVLPNANAVGLTIVKTTCIHRTITSIASPVARLRSALNPNVMRPVGVSAPAARADVDEVYREYVPRDHPANRNRPGEAMSARFAEHPRPTLARCCLPFEIIRGLQRSDHDDVPTINLEDRLVCRVKDVGGGVGGGIHSVRGRPVRVLHRSAGGHTLPCGTSCRRTASGRSTIRAGNNKGPIFRPVW